MSDNAEDEAIFCHLEPEAIIRHKTWYCTKGMWIVGGELVDFKTGFKKIYDKDSSIGKDKEISL